MMYPVRIVDHGVAVGMVDQGGKQVMVLYGIVLYCSILYYTVLYCSILYRWWSSKVEQVVVPGGARSKEEGRERYVVLYCIV